MPRQLFSPHARGWPADRAGWMPGSCCSPRTRGDGPGHSSPPIRKIKVLPARAGMARHARISRHGPWRVLPARAGMARLRVVIPRSRCGSPRTRGDGPNSITGRPSPGWVLPARAGMARGCMPWIANGFGFSPHARGWPVRWKLGELHPTRSPRTRGDGPAYDGPTAEEKLVLPARAGMARGSKGQARSLGRFSPHARGWPIHCVRLSWESGSSPRTRGDGPFVIVRVSGECCVLPARAGMARPTPARLKPSPAVLPARAGMARGFRHSQAQQQSSPRTRGDGPHGARPNERETKSSPRTRGDGPADRATAGPRSPFSPHARGWPGRC